MNATILKDSGHAKISGILFLAMVWKTKDAGYAAA